jgi:hypothetical protein
MNQPPQGPGPYQGPYGPPPGQGYGGTPQGYGGPGYGGPGFGGPPQGFGGPPPGAPRKKPNVLLIVLIIFGVLFVLGAGSCLVCVYVVNTKEHDVWQELQRQGRQSSGRDPGGAQPTSGAGCHAANAAACIWTPTGCNDGELRAAARTMGGTATAGSCPTTDLVGCCTMQKGSRGKPVTTCTYAPNVPAIATGVLRSTTESGCSHANGTWQTTPP